MVTLRAASWIKRAALMGLLLCAHPACAQIALVQSTGLFNNSSATSITATAFAANPAIGNTIVVMAWTWNPNGSPTIAVSDSRGNAYTAAAQATTGSSGPGFQNVAIFFAPVTATGANFKVTVSTVQNSTQIDAVAIEYSGVGALDQQKAVAGVSATATVTTPGATAAATELVVSALGINSPAMLFSSITPSAGFTTRAVQLQNAGDTGGGGADKIVNATGVQTNTWTASSALTQWVAAIATFRPSGGVTPDHFAISHSGNAVNCQAEPVTITAHNSLHAAVATTSTITLSTSTGRGDWSKSAGAGTFAAGASNSGSATYTYAAADNGVAVFALKDTYAETVSINVASGSVTEKTGSALASEDLNLPFAASGFRITNGSNVATTIGTRIAGLSSAAGSSAQSLALQAIRTDTSTGACTSVFASGTTVSVDMAYQCNDPTTCVAGQTLGITNNGTTTSIASNPNSGVSTYTSVPLRFSTVNGEAPFSLNYSDVGRITLLERYNIPLGSGANSGNTLTGTSQFVVQPAGFTLSSIKCTTFGAGTCNTALGAPGSNPAAAAANGAVFLPAGQNFSATVTAINNNGVATPNFGREVSPEGVKLTPSLVLPVGGRAAALNNATAFGAFSAGVATGTTFNWPEAGIMTLTPSIGDGSYLGSGDVVGTTTGNVGRFIPNSFGVALNTPLFGTACAAGGFTYVGQPFTYTVAPVITVTALSADGVTTTQNYTGAFMKLSNATLSGRSYTPTPASPSLNLAGLPATSADPTILDLGAGRVTLTFSAGSGLSYNRGTAVAPFIANIALGINVIDLDGLAAANPVTFGAGTGIGFSTSASQRYGRLFIRNAAGSELLELPVSMTTQYYLNSTQGFITNVQDSCTAAPILAFSNYQLNLTVGATCVRDSGSPGTSGLGCSTAAASPYRSSALGGDFNLILAASGAGKSGALTVTAAAPAWLQYLWNAGSGINSNPSGVATFGVFPGPAQRIYQREVY